LALVVRAGHPILQSPAPEPEQLTHLHWIVPREGTPARDYFKVFFAAQGLPAPPHIIECSSLVATRGLLLSSDRAALLSARQVGIELASGQLSVLLNPLPGTERAIGLTVRRDWQPTPLLKNFLTLVRAAIPGEVHATARR
jgi:DNA-binding transcriptional LysR family regulator